MAKFHISISGEPVECTATDRLCPRGGLDAHYESKAEAEAAHEQALSEQFGESTTVAKVSETPSLSGTKVVDASGKPLTVYHGSGVDFETFDEAHTGRGNDSFGSGFYFTTSKEAASGYGEHLKSVQLNIQNPIEVDGKDGSINYNLSTEQVKELLLKMPNAYSQPDDDEPSPIGDYAEEYWESDSHSKEAIEAMADRVAREELKGSGFVEMETVYGRDEATAFRNAIAEVTGHDGVHVSYADEGVEHWVAWRSDQISTVSS